MLRAVFLDRDGVLNRAIVRDGKPYPPQTLAELELLPDIAECLKQLKEKGFLLIVVTNQPDVARGKQTQETIAAMHSLMKSLLPVDEFRVCFHDDAQDCGCRKPKPGLLMQAALERGISLADSYMVGDRWRDVDAGAAAGCRSVWIDRGYRERAPVHTPEARVSDLCEAVRWILKDSEKPNEAR
jgi:D-glycero-D-manno-heptose 1,7-bisphosphate phosphatase